VRDANAAACVLKREQDVTTSERQRRRPRRPRWQFTWTHQRCDCWQLEQNALLQHAQPLRAARRSCGGLPDSPGPSSRARGLHGSAVSGYRAWGPPASSDHEPRLQAPPHGWSRRRVFVGSDKSDRRPSPVGATAARCQLSVTKVRP